MAKTLFVRVQPKSGQKTFFRCGTKFSQAWQEVEVDDATAARLEAEQMLEVSETRPAELENETPNADDPAGGSGSGTGSGAPAPAPTTGAAATKPDDPAEVALAILAAIGQLDKEDAALWTVGGNPAVSAIAAITGWPVSAAERDAALAVAE